MSTLTVETARDGQVRPLAFTRDPAPLLGLMAFGVAEPFGSQHPLTILVRRLKREHGLDVAPLLSYYDRDVRDAEDREKLAAAWQDAAPLRACVAAVRAAIAADPEAPALLAGFETIPDLLAELEALSETAARGGGRIRLSFTLA